MRTVSWPAVFKGIHKAHDEQWTPGNIIESAISLARQQIPKKYHRRVKVTPHDDFQKLRIGWRFSWTTDKGKTSSVVTSVRLSEIKTMRASENMYLNTMLMTDDYETGKKTISKQVGRWFRQ